jgi:predicted RNA-binding Zn ribbon-like protein
VAYISDERIDDLCRALSSSIQQELAREVKMHRANRAAPPTVPNDEIDRDDLLEYLADARQGCITHGRFDEADMYRDYHTALSKMLTELQTLRGLEGADKERVRAVVRKATQDGYDFAENKAEISEHDGWHRTDPRIEWPDYSEQVAALDAIADRAAEQLASTSSSTVERCDACDWTFGCFNKPDQCCKRSR